MKEATDPLAELPNPNLLIWAMRIFSVEPDEKARKHLASQLILGPYKLIVPMVEDDAEPAEKKLAWIADEDGDRVLLVFTEAKLLPKGAHGLQLLSYMDVVDACIADKVDTLIIDAGESHCVATLIEEDNLELFCPKHNDASADPLSSLRMS